MRDLFADIDRSFHGAEMQDASEFLLRLLDTMKEELDARHPSANPVRDNFEYRTIDSSTCLKCHETALTLQENICWFVAVPHCQGISTPTLHEALRLSMQPNRRELLCQLCHHKECRVTTKVCQLPRILIIQLNRYVFQGQECKKIQTSVNIPELLSLNELVTDDVTQPTEWKHSSHPLCTLSEPGKSEGPPASSPRLAEFGAEADRLQCPVDLTVGNAYRLVGVVSHYGGTAHSGHYVSDVYSVEKELWLRYDDSRVSCTEDDILKDTHQRNGYISFYIHRDVFNLVVSAGAALSAPCLHALPMKPSNVQGCQ